MNFLCLSLDKESYVKIWEILGNGKILPKNLRKTKQNIISGLLRNEIYVKRT